MYKYTCYLFKLFAKKNPKKKKRLTITCNAAKLQEHCMLNCALLTYQSQRTHHSTRPGPWEQLQWKTQIIQYHINFSIVHENQFFY